MKGKKHFILAGLLLAASGVACAFGIKAQVDKNAAAAATEVTETDPETGETNVTTALLANYDEYVRDTQIFGISLGTLISVTIMAVSKIIEAGKTAQKWAEIKEGVEKNDSVVETAAGVINGFKSDCDEIAANLQKALDESKEQIEQYRIKIDELTDSLATATKALSNYSAANAKLDVIIENQKTMAGAEQYVVSGIADKVNKNSSEVK